jgi:hypothetical protein
MSDSKIWCVIKGLKAGSGCTYTGRLILNLNHTCNAWDWINRLVRLFGYTARYARLSVQRLGEEEGEAGI